MILLDTQALIWLAQADPRLGRLARASIETERADDIVLVSPISAWETAMLADKGKVALGRPVRQWFELVLSTPGFCPADLTTAIGADAGSLPDGIHGDPADRLVVATARSYGCPLVTADRKILAYAATGHLKAIDARR